MKKTMYFTTNYKPGIRIWRYKNGKMEFYSAGEANYTARWLRSCCEIGANNGDGWRQISRDVARKIQGQAFR